MRVEGGKGGGAEKVEQVEKKEIGKIGCEGGGCRQGLERVPGVRRRTTW